MSLLMSLVINCNHAILLQIYNAVLHCSSVENDLDILYAEKILDVCTYLTYNYDWYLTSGLMSNLVSNNIFSFVFVFMMYEW
jgi:hypothetical protein